MFEWLCILLMDFWHPPFLLSRLQELRWICRTSANIVSVVTTIIQFYSQGFCKSLSREFSFISTSVTSDHEGPSLSSEMWLFYTACLLGPVCPPQPYSVGLLCYYIVHWCNHNYYIWVIIIMMIVTSLCKLCLQVIKQTIDTIIMLKQLDLGLLDSISLSFSLIWCWLC